jgi:oligosaccharide repeat unit polymerase
MFAYYFLRVILPSSANSSNYYETMARFRIDTSFTKTIDITIVQSVMSGFTMGSYLCIYTLISNAINGYKNTKLTIAAAAISIFLSMFSSATRGTAINNCIFALIIYLFKWRSSKGKFSRKILNRVFIFIICILAVFVLLRGLVGRSLDFDSLYYLSIYIGAPVNLFDLYIKNPIHNEGAIFGKYTFSQFYNFLGSLFSNKNLVYTTQYEFRQTPTGLMIGNAATFLRAFIQDFGFATMFLLVAIEYIVLNLVYGFICNQRQRRISIPLLMYGYYSQIYVLAFFNDRFYTYLFVNQIKTALLLYAFMYFFKLRERKEALYATM